MDALNMMQKWKRICQSHRCSGENCPVYAECSKIINWSPCAYGNQDISNFIKGIELAADPNAVYHEPQSERLKGESLEVIKTRLQVVKTKLMSGLVIQAYQELNEVLEVMK